MLAAVIVTYNRKKLLCENLKMLYKQSIVFDKIIVVDNCSNDGTYEYLNQQGYTIKNNFVYLKTESNIGGAGGFYIGTKYAYEISADWILLMDDDGQPANEYTFEELTKVAYYLYNKNVNGGKLFVNSLVQKDNLLSFKINDMYTVKEALEYAKNGIIENAANPFNGTLISRELIKEIGYPNKDFFIKGDEVDFKQRAYDVGAYVCTVINSRYIHPRPKTYEKKILGIKVPFFVEAPWKEYYTCRNFTYMYKEKKQYKAIVFELLLVKFLAICSFKCPKLKTMGFVLRGFKDGWKGRLGPIVRP